MKLKIKKERKDNSSRYIALGSDKTKYDFVCDIEKGTTLNKKKIDLEIIEEDDFTYVRYGNKKYQVEVLEINQNKYTILINGVSYSFTIETPISYKRRKFLDKTKTKSKIEQITAPMPGKILDILVDVTSKVKAGEPLVILEAMKMQNEILSTVSGTVKKIYVKTEDTVNKDDIMIEITK